MIFENIFCYVIIPLYRTRIYRIPSLIDFWVLKKFHRSSRIKITLFTCITNLGLLPSDSLQRGYFVLDYVVLEIINKISLFIDDHKNFLNYYLSWIELCPRCFERNPIISSEWKNWNNSLYFRSHRDMPLCIHSYSDRQWISVSLHHNNDDITHTHNFIPGPPTPYFLSKVTKTS